MAPRLSSWAKIFSMQTGRVLQGNQSLRFQKSDGFTERLLFIANTAMSPVTIAKIDMIRSSGISIDIAASLGSNTLSLPSSYPTKWP